MKRFRRFSCKNIRLSMSPVGVVLDVHFEDRGKPCVVELDVGEDHFDYHYPVSNPEDARRLKRAFCVAIVKAMIGLLAVAAAPWLAFLLVFAALLSIRVHPAATLPFQ